MAYSLEPVSQDCYPGTTVLVNKLNIRDEATLNEAEALITYINASKLEHRPLESVFDFTHYKVIYHFLFSELYDWAGRVRTVNINKKATCFCRAERIETRAQLIFQRLKERDCFKKFSYDVFVDEIVDFYCVTNMLILSGRAMAARKEPSWHN